MYYLTDTGYPIISNAPAKTWTACDKEIYDKKCSEINAKSEADRLASEEALKPAIELEAKIQAKIREMAIKELEKSK